MELFYADVRKVQRFEVPIEAYDKQDAFEKVSENIDRYIANLEPEEEYLECDPDAVYEAEP